METDPCASRCLYCSINFYSIFCTHPPPICTVSFIITCATTILRYVSGTDYPCTLPSTESTLPVATIDGYVKLANNDYNSVMNAIASIGPLAINVDASTWHAYEGGIFNGCNQKNPDVNHVVVMVGYGEVSLLRFFNCFFGVVLIGLCLQAISILF